jgi:hypothetical protein
VLSGEEAGQSANGTCTDAAGNSASAVVNGINIDRTPPVISLTPSAPTLWPPDGKLVPDTISGTINDVLSGVDPSSVTFRVIDSYGVVQPTGSISLSPTGEFSFVVNLEASRRGQDLGGRTYQIIISGKDAAGNSASASTGVTVPHDQR